MGVVSMNCGAEHLRDLPCVTDPWGTGRRLQKRPSRLLSLGASLPVGLRE